MIRYRKADSLLDLIPVGLLHRGVIHKLTVEVSDVSMSLSSEILKATALRFRSGNKEPIFRYERGDELIHIYAVRMEVYPNNDMPSEHMISIEFTVRPTGQSLKDEKRDVLWREMCKSLEDWTTRMKGLI